MASNAANTASTASTANMANTAKTEQIDYGAYRLTAAETVLASAISMGLVFGAMFVFYRSFIASALLAPLGLLYLPRRRKAQIARRREQLKQQFRDMLYSLSSSLMAGKTMESALREARGDLEIMYPDPETLLLREIDAMLRKASMNESIESALADLADRSGIEDIESFCSVISICRKTGGNLVEIVKNTTNILGDKLEIKNEIDILLAQRKFEKKVLNAMPIVLILVLSAAAGEYIEPVFTTMIGRAVMSAAIALILLSWAVSAKIMDINV
ncbi:MAG: pilus assembly protein TadB [Clostridiales bacterium]|jgi:tight adherence protein B|nr:pilus assembly protein TadB [Clostridiales bacterium]